MRKEWLEAGEIVATHGIRGAVKLMPWTDGPEFIRNFRRVRIDGTDYDIVKCSVQGTCDLLQLQGIDTVEQAQALRGKIPLLCRAEAPEGLIFACELMGMDVFTEGAYLGTVTDVLDYPGNKVYEVTGEKQYWIPAVKQFILKTDLEANRMDVVLLEGMETDAD